MSSPFKCCDIVNGRKAEGIVCSNELAEVVLSPDFAICNFEAALSRCG